MSRLERQLLVVQKLRNSMPEIPRMSFQLNEMLNIKAHQRERKFGTGRDTEKGFEENCKETN